MLRSFASHSYLKSFNKLSLRSSSSSSFYYSLKFQSNPKYNYIPYQTSTYSYSTDNQDIDNSVSSSSNDINTLNNDSIGSISHSFEDIDFTEELVTTGKEIVVESVTNPYNFDLSTTFYTFARVLTEIHDTHLIPWWLLITASSVIIKVIVSPFMVYSAKIAAQIQQEEKNIEAISTAFKRDKPKMNVTQAAELRKKIAAYYKSKGINPARNFLAVFTVMPVQIYTFLQLRAITLSNYPGLSTEGMFWFSNLTIADPLYIIPFTSTMLSIINMRVGPLAAKRRGLVLKPTMEILQTVFAGAITLFGIYVCFFPAGLQYLILLNIISTLVLTLSYRIPAVRRLFKLPPNIGIQFSMQHSEPKRIEQAFGKSFGKSKPPDINYTKKKTIFQRIMSLLK